MAEKPWWQRWEGMPWDGRPDAEETNRFLNERLERSGVARVAGVTLALIYATGASVVTQTWDLAVLLGLIAVATGGFVWRHRRKFARF